MAKSQVLLIFSFLVLSLTGRNLFCSEITRTFYPFDENLSERALELEPSSSSSSNQQGKTSQAQAAVAACQRRFRNYSEIDFQEQIRYKLKLEGLKYGSFFEYLRGRIIQEDLKQIFAIKQALEAGILKFPTIKHWLMLDKLMRDPVISNGYYEALTEYLFIVLELKEDEQLAGSENRQLQQLHLLKFETLKHAIKTLKPLIIFKALLENVKSSLTPHETVEILETITSSLHFWNHAQISLPDGFFMLPIALEELNSEEWFKALYDNENSDEPLQILLISFYLILSNSRHQPFLFNLLNDCVFDLNRENMEIISKFIEITKFCSFIEQDIEVYNEKLRRFEFILQKFEVSELDFEKEFSSAIERNCLGFLEAILIFFPNFLSNDEEIPKQILKAIKSRHLEAAILISSFRQVSSDEFMATYRNLVNVQGSLYDFILVRIVKNFLSIFDEFDGDFGDCSEIENDDGSVSYQFPEPVVYERLAAYPRNYIIDQVMNNHFIARKILALYFGIPFTCTRVRFDSDCVPLWREVADVVNFFLDLYETNYQVDCNQKGSSSSFRNIIR